MSFFKKWSYLLVGAALLGAFGGFGAWVVYESQQPKRPSPDAVTNLTFEIKTVGPEWQGGADSTLVFTDSAGINIGHVKDSYVTPESAETRLWQVVIELNSEGAELFENVTTENVGKPVGLFVDGVLLSAPIVQQPIPGGQMIITGNFSFEEASAIADALNEGRRGLLK